MNPRPPTASASLHVEVIADAAPWNTLPDLEGWIGRAAEIAAEVAAADGAAIDADEMTVLLTDDARMRALNRDYRGKDIPTNVLSFPSIPTPHAPSLGDIALGYETLCREAEEEGKALRNHLAHLVVHGTLHLFGYDHLDDEEADTMEGLEIEALARLGLPNPYEFREETMKE